MKKLAGFVISVYRSMSWATLVASRWALYLLLLVPLLLGTAWLVRNFPQSRMAPALVWGSTPIHNFALWSRAMKAAGHSSTTYTHQPFAIHERADWDRVLSEEYPRRSQYVASHLGFLKAMREFDVFFLPANGFFLGFESSALFPNLFRRLHGSLLKYAGKKIVLLPYGADAYVYRRVRSPELQHGLMLSYPVPARQQQQISRDLDFWVDIADVVIPGFMGFDGIGRWDVLTPSPLIVDLAFWPARTREQARNGSTVVVGHAPNHRGFKGSEFVIKAIEDLKLEGLDVELLLLEGMTLRQVRDALVHDVDILVEQLLFFGHGLNGLEGMAVGLPVISNLEAKGPRSVLDSYTFFGDCPIISAQPETVADVLRELIADPEKRATHGLLGRQYVERWHSAESARFLFESVISFLDGEQFALKNLFHPLTERIPKERR